MPDLSIFRTIFLVLVNGVLAERPIKFLWSSRLLIPFSLSPALVGCKVFVLQALLKQVGDGKSCGNSDQSMRLPAGYLKDTGFG